MSKVFVVTVLVSIVSENVTETFDVNETEVSPSEGELDDTVGGVVSDDEEVDEILVCLELLVEERLALRSLMRCCIQD